MLRLLSSSLVVLWLGCGDDSAAVDAGGATTTDGGGSVDAAGRDAAGSDAGETVGGLAGYCAAASAYLGRCSAMLRECDRESLTQCTGTYSVERQEIIDARAECGFPDGCTDPEPYATRRCVYDATVDVMPTGAQHSLAQAFCAACGSAGPGECLEDFFFRAEPRDDGSVAVSGTGASYFDYNDTVVAAIASDCVPPAGTEGCHQMFYDCVRATVEAAQPASVGEACSIVGPGPTPSP
jgi:hypothetical protein